jgi:hypothetical protein
VYEHEQVVVQVPKVVEFGLVEAGGQGFAEVPVAEEGVVEVAESDQVRLTVF